MRKMTVIMVAGALLGLSQAGDARACTCLPSPPPMEALGESDAVFAGRVVEVSRGTDPLAGLTARFEVSRVWKGEVGERVEVRTPSNSAACGLGFEAGEEWLVYAHRREGGELGATLCSRSSLLRTATADLEALGSGSAPGGEEPTPVPGGGSSCAMGSSPAGGAAPWGALAVGAAAGAVGLWRRQGRRRAVS